MPNFTCVFFDIQPCVCPGNLILHPKIIIMINSTSCAPIVEKVCDLIFDVDVALAGLTQRATYKV